MHVWTLHACSLITWISDGQMHIICFIYWCSLSFLKDRNHVYSKDKLHVCKLYIWFVLYKLLFLPVCFSHFPGVRTSWFNSSMEWKKISYLGGSPYHDSCTIGYRQDRKAHGMTCTYRIPSAFLDSMLQFQNIQKSEYSLAPNNKLLLLVFVNVEPLWLEQTNKCVW